MDFFPFVGHLLPHRAKNDLRKKEGTMLPAPLSLPALSLSKGRRAGYSYGARRSRIVGTPAAMRRSSGLTCTSAWCGWCESEPPVTSRL
jgi:hypothetical protein